MNRLGSFLLPPGRDYDFQNMESGQPTVMDKPHVKTTFAQKLKKLIPLRLRKRKPPINVRDLPHVRIIDRDGQFHQSKGKVIIQRQIVRKDFIALYSNDWFHSLLDTPTYRIVILLMVNYLLIALIFAIAYYVLSVTVGCGLGITNLIQAMLFSLETMSTVGYGTQDIFFGGCLSAALIFSLQVLISLIVTALVIGVIYHRVSRPQTRASTIVFSNKGMKT